MLSRVEATKEEIMTEAQFWIDRGGLWRVARKQFRCANHTCKHARILPGTRYVDTNERTQDGVWATMKICPECAAREIKSLGAQEA